MRVVSFRGLSLAMLMAMTGVVHAALIAPSSWVRGVDPSSTYQEWDIFNSPAGPNPPNSPGVPAGSTVAAAPFNSNGVANVVETSGASFRTGGGNIYSPSAIVDVDVTVPNFAAAAATWTTVILQTRTQGSSLDVGSVRLTSPAGTVSPADSALLFTQALGGPGGTLEDRWFQFVLPGNAAAYTLEFAGAETSVSLDKVSVDTVWTTAATALQDPNPVPEPAAGTLAFIAGSAIAGLAAIRRRRSKRMQG
jgi:hypothetical protein